MPRPAFWSTVAVLILCASASRGAEINASSGVEDGTWSLVDIGAGPRPSSRSEHVAVYDPVEDRMVVFGGQNQTNETWLLSLSGESTWSPMTSTPTPTGRKDAVSVYDSARRRMILFGGYDNNYLNDVWTLSLGPSPTWQQLFPAGVYPSGRMLLQGIYDPIRDRLIIFGGHPLG